MTGPLAFALLQTVEEPEISGSDGNFMVYLLIAAVVVAIAFGNRALARSRRRDQSTWYWLGVVFPIVSLAVLAALPTVPEDDEGVVGRRFGRRQIVGVIFGILGILMVFLLAPALTDQIRAFAFEPPKFGEQLQWGFSPRILVRIVGFLYWIVAGVSFLPKGRDRVAMIAQVVAAVVAIPTILAIALALSATATNTNVIILLDQSLFLATPVALGAMTGLWSERVGIINIGIEGMMLGAAGVGFMTYALLGNASSVPWMWIGIFVAVLTGGLLAMLLAVLAIRFKVDQIVGGVVINIFALGLTGFLRSQVIVPSGHTDGFATPDIAIPLLNRIPIVGDTLFTGPPLYYLMYLVVFMTWLVMFRTAWGLRVRSCGENPHAAETVGINVIKTRYLSVLVGGFIAGLAGAWYSMESTSGFEDNMTSGFGFIALAAMIFGKWTPWGAFGGAMLFGFARALGSRLQFLNVEVAGFSIPSEFFQAVPFIVTLVVVAGALGRAIPPAAEGQAFEPSK
ncbi:MAG: ABC transporter permease [Actinobacteria bacterium]|nr:ABC transporter permease [Actinomycetota bacterium]